jgi:hypothetical protein
MTIRLRGYDNGGCLVKQHGCTQLNTNGFEKYFIN